MKELDDIEARANSATKAPWTATEYDDYPGDEGVPIIGGGEVGSMDGHLVSYALALHDKPQCVSDGEFIAHAREDVPKLVAALKAVLALPHEDYCCTKGCPGGGQCGNGVINPENCMNYCSCFLSGPIRAINDAFGVETPVQTLTEADLRWPPPPTGTGFGFGGW